MTCPAVEGTLLFFFIYLSKELLKVVVKQWLKLGETGKWCVIAH